MKAATLLPEFDHEMKTTRSVLERVQWDKKDWRPHTKSFTFGALAGHVGEVTKWCTSTFTGTGIDMAEKPYVAPTFSSLEDLLKDFDSQVIEARKAIEQTSDESFMEDWTLQHGAHIIFSMPRIAVYRSFVMNHMIHHRGQLSVYLRMQEIPIPSIYGPTADTQG